MKGSRDEEISLGLYKLRGHYHEGMSIIINSIDGVVHNSVLTRQVYVRNDEDI